MRQQTITVVLPNTRSDLLAIVTHALQGTAAQFTGSAFNWTLNASTATIVRSSNVEDTVRETAGSMGACLLYQSMTYRLLFCRCFRVQTVVVAVGAACCAFGA